MFDRIESLGLFLIISFIPILMNIYCWL